MLVFETKGEHLRDNPDTDYKRRVLDTLQTAFNCGTMTIRDGPAKGTFRLVFSEDEFPITPEPPLLHPDRPRERCDLRQRLGCVDGVLGAGL